MNDSPWVIAASACGVVTYRKIEALCSFLQGENLGNFQSLQKCLRRLACQQKASRNKRSGHSGFTYHCVELLYRIHLSYFGLFLGPSP